MPFLVIKIAGQEPFRVPFDQGPLRVGRSQENDICLTEDPTASRFHAVFTTSDGKFFVEDAASRHGIKVNRLPVTGPQVLQPGDRIRMGQTEIQFTYQDMLEEATGSLPATPMGGETMVVPVFETLQSSIAVSGTGRGEEAAAEAVTVHSRAFSVLSRGAEELLAQKPLEDLLRTVLKMVFEAAAPERGVIMLLEGDPPRLRVRVERGGNGTGSIQPSRTIAEMAIRQQAAVLTRDAQLDERLAGSESVMLQGIRSAMCVPLWNNKKVIGLIYLDCVDSVEKFSREDLEVLTLLGNVAAIKIENVRLFQREQKMREMEQELAAAATIQRRLLPASPPPVSGYDLAGCNFPCREVGGDYFDFQVRGNGRLGLAIGDVSGKGMGAALLMATLQAAFRAHAATDVPVAELVCRLNRAIFSNCDPDKFITFFFGELDPESGRLAYTNAGHNPPLLVRGNGPVERLQTGDLILGFQPGVDYSVKETTLQPGDLLVLYSDGITESRDPAGAEFEEEGLLETVFACRSLPVGEIERRVVSAVETFTGEAEQADDITLTLIRRE